MKENLKYINHLNEVYEFSKEESYVFEHTLRNYSWNVITKNNRVAGFNKSISAKSITLIIHARDELHGFEIRNRLYEITEKDVLAEKPGKLILDGYYLSCYVTESQKREFMYRKRHMELDLTVTTDYPYWCRETNNSYNKGMTAELHGIDFPTDYPYDYCLDMASDRINNPGFASANFKIIIYGPAANPSVTIGDHIYRVNCTVGQGEYLTIDSIRKKIFITDNQGATTNKFNDRLKTSYIFEKILPGANTVAWSSDFGFDVILFDERSEPKWT